VQLPSENFRMPIGYKTPITTGFSILAIKQQLLGEKRGKLSMNLPTTDYHIYISEKLKNISAKQKVKRIRNMKLEQEKLITFNSKNKLVEFNKDKYELISLLDNHVQALRNVRLELNRKISTRVRAKQALDHLESIMKQTEQINKKKEKQQQKLNDIFDKKATIIEGYKNKAKAALNKKIKYYKGIKNMALQKFKYMKMQENDLNNKKNDFYNKKSKFYEKKEAFYSSKQKPITYIKKQSTKPPTKDPHEVFRDPLYNFQ